MLRGFTAGQGRSRWAVASAVALSAALAGGVVGPGGAAQAAGAATDTATDVTYHFIDIGVIGVSPGGDARSDGNAINSARQVVGSSTIPQSGGFRAYLWQEGEITDLGALQPDPDGGFSTANGINEAGKVVGAAHVDQTSPMHAFIRRRGALEDLGTGFGPGSGSAAHDINGKNLVVGEHTASQAAPASAVLWNRSGRIRDLGTLGGSTTSPYATNSIAYAINDSRQVVGTALPTAGVPLHGFLWENGAMRDLGTLGGNTEATVAHDINNSAVVVGFSQNAAGETHAFRWEDDTMLDLGVLGPDFLYRGSDAYGINASGVVVGTSNVADGGFGQPTAFIWEDGVMLDLNPLVTDLPGGTSLEFAFAINDDGVIVGRASTGRAFMLVPNS